MGAKTDLTPQSEDYLEAILALAEPDGSARARDIAGRLGVHKSTVTGALKSLAEKGLVEYARYGATHLTAAGRAVARDVARRHEALRRFLKDVLLLDAAQAEANACRIEHAVDPETVGRLRQFVDFLGECPRCRKRWREYLEGHDAPSGPAKRQPGRGADKKRKPARRPRNA